MDKTTERKKMIACIEYIARQVNDEDVFEYWLTMGVADGDIKYGDLSTDDIDDYYIDDKNFKEMMTTFLILMNKAYKSGGLYCGDVVSLDKNDLIK